MEKAAVKDNRRYERKFIYQNFTPEDLIETVILTNPSCFREIFYRRRVNNIYFDDQAMSFYHQNVSGDELRDKYRLRWYGNTFENIQDPVLEIKKKHGVIGNKLLFPLKGFTHKLEKHSKSQLQKDIYKNIMDNHSPEIALKINNLSPSLYNSYERRYFLSDCKKFRITIDYNMTFYNPHFSFYQSSKTELTDIILELKYEVKDDKESRKITQTFQSRLSKNSKYVRGIDLIHHL